MFSESPKRNFFSLSNILRKSWLPGCELIGYARPNIIPTCWVRQSDVFWMKTESKKYSTVASVIPGVSLYSDSVTIAIHISYHLIPNSLWLTRNIKRKETWNKSVPWYISIWRAAIEEITCLKLKSSHADAPSCFSIQWPLNSVLIRCSATY